MLWRRSPLLAPRRRFAAALRCALITLCSIGGGAALAQGAPGTAPPAAPAPAAPAPVTPAPAAPAPAAPAGQAPAAEPTAEEAAPVEGAAEAETAVPAEGTEPAPGPAPELPAAPPPGAPAISGVPQPGEMEQMLNEQMPPATPGSDWTAPTPVLTLHGYLRVRGELMDTFWLGRDTTAHVVEDAFASGGLPRADGFGQGPDPFSRFRPAENRPQVSAGDAEDMALPDCVDEDGVGTCDVSTLQFANMRLRLSPELALSEEVRIHATFDVLDNLVLGDGPQSFYGTGPGQLGVFTGTDEPGGGLGDSIKARRAYGVVAKRNLGELRFGRMGQEWGLGMLYNAGDGYDDDRSTDLDRVHGVVKLIGVYLSAAYDFAAEGELDYSTGRPIDQSQLDDLDQFTFGAFVRDTPEELSAAMEKGELVLNAGLQLQIRNQDATYTPFGDDAEERMKSKVDGLTGIVNQVAATTYTPDLWAMLRYRGLRIEAEAAWIHGSMDDPTDGAGTYDIDALGYALETELRLVNDQLGLYFDHGLATGDSDVDGLSSDANFVSQLGQHHNDTVSTFRFHPNYRVDLIMWRNIMEQVTGAYYFKPGISYDFIRSEYGQLLGARLDAIWSRASSFVQTWGNDPDLGVEVDISLYYRTEDGPELEDGFYAKLQYGALFPMRGLSFRHEDTDLEVAQTLRLQLGIVY